jgi:hypothetical protein
MRKLLTAVLWPKRQPGKLYLPVGFILVAAGIIYTAALGLYFLYDTATRTYGPCEVCAQEK